MESESRGVVAWRVLRVDLTTGTITRETLDPKLNRQFIGGNGVSIKYVYDEVPAHVKPLDPENRLVFSAGPLCGTSIPGSGTYTVATKGPISGGLASAQANGFFGARMRQAGFDTIIVQGASKEWKYLYIHDGEAELKSADELLGLGNWETEDLLKEQYGSQASIASIGPAGENGVRFAAISNDHGHVASANGPGAVMASKKLKAIVAHPGKDSLVEVKDPELLKETRKAFKDEADSTAFGGMIATVGTHGYFSTMNLVGGLAVKNYTTNDWPGIERWDGQAIRDRYKRKPVACWRCPYAHCSEIKIHDGAFEYEGEEPEYEMLTAWTMNIGNSDFAWAVKLSNLTDNLGLCMKETMWSVSMAMELFEKGEIGLEETGGINLTWNNPAAVEVLLNQIATRTGFGDVLADGVKAAAERIGGAALDCAVYMGTGTATHGVDGRAYWPLLFCLMLSDSGSFYGASQEDLEVGVDEAIGMQDNELIGFAQSKCSTKWVLMDTLGTCMFFTMGRHQPAVDSLNAVMGWDMTLDEYLTVGRRIKAVSRAFNVMNGMTLETMTSNSPRFTMPQVDGMWEGVDVNPHIQQVAEDFFTGCGWDIKTSKPLPETLKELDLEYIAKDLGW